ncbi:MAG: c-type cytochrome [Burkholderiales bacterium]|nr:c-type cytochrome [Burkholderiales bacterium]
MAQGAGPLVSGPGMNLTLEKCQTCHEIAHVTRAPMSRGEWADNLHRMRERGAQFTDEEFEVILNYLATYYGRDPAPPPAPDTYAAGSDPIAALLRTHGCSACHASDQRLVGPSFREVAARYAGDAAAAAQLAQRIRNGTQGVWGPVPMPPVASISDAELAQVVAWVLAQR